MYASTNSNDRLIIHSEQGRASNICNRSNRLHESISWHPTTSAYPCIKFPDAGVPRCSAGSGHLQRIPRVMREHTERRRRERNLHRRRRGSGKLERAPGYSGSDIEEETGLHKACDPIWVSLPYWAK